jgi:hypothetical protein
MRRPESLHEAALRMNATIEMGRVAHEALSYHMSDFRHALKGKNSEWIRQAIEREPVQVDAVVDVWLGGFAEYLAFRDRVPVPAWVEDPSRFLPKEVYWCSKSVFMAGLVYTPPPWLRRKLICEEPELDFVR